LNLNTRKNDAPMPAARPIHHGATGAVSAAHPLAVSTGLETLRAGGNACDAMIASQAALAVVAPASAGLGGDLLALIKSGDRAVTAINGTGCAPSDPRFEAPEDGGLSVAVPGMVDGWLTAHRMHGRIDFARCLAPAIALARDGCRLASETTIAVSFQKQRVVAGGGEDWPVLAAAESGSPVSQPEIAALLEAIASGGGDAFYKGPMAEAMARAIARQGGWLSSDDLATHETIVTQALSVPWQDGQVHVQPPITQGVLLAMCLKALAAQDVNAAASLDHLCIELTEASFQYRSRADEGAALLDTPLEIDPQRASLKGGPRAYLHTAGVATADADGMVCSSLVSIFDHFGSGVFVPEGGFTLNNRAQSFTSGANAPAPGKRPVHTLAPAMLETPGGTMALATPGADGQIQTLLQVIAKHTLADTPLAEAIDAPRWRSQDGQLLIATNHPQREQLGALGHRIADRQDIDLSFGGLVCAGHDGAAPFAGSDWRRDVWHGVA
jgi:gamma-glutamyltranspeptidase/glutathione hydrolase